MKKFIDVFKQKNMATGYLYFYVHFITEVVCFVCLKRIVGNLVILWLSPLLYDMFAFVPQAMFGYIKDKYPKFNPGVIGTFIMILAVINFMTNILPLRYLSVVILALGNGLMHVDAAVATLRSSEGKLSQPAIFVAGGSFGVITGKILGDTLMPMWVLIILALTMIPFCLLGQSYVENINTLKKFNYANDKVNPMVLILLTTLVVIVRGYAGYGIPTTWNQTLLQTVMLFSFMGIGKALGGIFIDAFGMKKTALLSVLVSIPFLVFGDTIMIVSLIGTMLFSMTMAVTLGLLVSVLKDNPGLAFGYTTIGLFLGTIPIFFITIKSVLINSLIVSTLSIICYIVLKVIIRKEDKND